MPKQSKNIDILHTFLTELKSQYPRDFEYTCHLFVRFLLIKMVRKMSKEDIQKLALRKDDTNVDQVLEIVGQYVDEDGNLYTETINEFKTITYA
jgi:hypothetical protein